MRILAAFALVVLTVTACSRAASSAAPARAPSAETPAAPQAAPATTSVAAAPNEAPVAQKETGGLTGSVVRGPRSPVGGISASRSPAPVAGAKIIVSPSAGGPEIKSVVTDAEGRYQVSLPPGTYLITLGPAGSYLFTKDLPATITVTAGQTTKLDVLLDTGIR